MTNLKTLMGNSDVEIIVNAMEKERVLYMDGVKEQLENKLINEELRIIISIYLSLKKHFILYYTIYIYIIFIVKLNKII